MIGRPSAQQAGNQLVPVVLPALKLTLDGFTDKLGAVVCADKCVDLLDRLRGQPDIQNFHFERRPSHGGGRSGHSFLVQQNNTLFSVDHIKSGVYINGIVY